MPDLADTSRLCYNFCAIRNLNHTDALTASRVLTRLENLDLLRRSEQRRGPGVYYTLVEEDQITSQVTPHDAAEQSESDQEVA